MTKSFDFDENLVDNLKGIQFSLELSNICYTIQSCIKIIVMVLKEHSNGNSVIIHPKFKTKIDNKLTVFNIYSK